jgi:hypothetical protein
MPKEARRHHYISEFYLNGFTYRDGKAKKLIALNRQENNYFTPTAKNLANVRDFNSINIPGMKADAVETILSDFETKAAVAIQEVHTARKFEGENRLLILELMAMFTSRNPNRRENTNGFMSEVFKKSTTILLNHDSELRRLSEDLATKLGAKESSKMSAQELNNFIHDKTKLELSKEYYLHTESIFIQSIFNALAHRKWVLVQASEQTGPIITSDNPLILCWNDPESVPAFHRESPGHAMQNTTVYFSLSQHLSLVGTFDGEEIIAPPNEALVAINNTMHIIHAYNQVYLPTFDFRLLTKDHGIQDGHWLKTEYKITKK